MKFMRNIRAIIKGPTMLRFLEFLKRNSKPLLPEAPAGPVSPQAEVAAPVTSDAALDNALGRLSFCYGMKHREGLVDNTIFSGSGTATRKRFSIPRSRVSEILTALEGDRDLFREYKRQGRREISVRSNIPSGPFSGVSGLYDLLSVDEGRLPHLSGGRESPQAVAYYNVPIDAILDATNILISECDKALMAGIVLYNPDALRTGPLRPNL
jgi:hypothetical protein